MTKEVAKKIVRGITDKIECNTIDIDDWAEFWGFTREEYEEFLDMAIKSLEQTRWIPVSERLPKEYGEYICTMSNGDIQECGFVPSGEKELILGWSTCEADGFKKLDYQDVTAWMPLPQPYTESEDAK